MKKSTFLFILIITLLLGYTVGKKGLGKKSTTPYTYNIQIPQSLKGEDGAFSEIVKVISPLVVNISTSKTVSKKDSSPFSEFFDGSLQDYFDPFRMPKKWKEESLGS